MHQAALFGWLDLGTALVGNHVRARLLVLIGFDHDSTALGDSPRLVKYVFTIRSALPIKDS